MQADGREKLFRYLKQGGYSLHFMTLVIYGMVVLIWGGGFIAVEFQLGLINEEVSVLYRFAAATTLILIYIAISRKPMFSFQMRDHFLFALIGLFFFSCNFFLIYSAQKYLTSGIVAIAFSMALFFTQINSLVFLRMPLRLKTAIGGGICIAGLVLVFRDTIFLSDLGHNMTKGMLLILAAAYIVSLANVVTAKITARGLPIIQSNAWAMIYGTLYNFFIVVLLGGEFVYDTRISYWVSFVYLAALGSVVGFLLYFALVRRIGPERSVPALTILAPLIAFIVSVVVEELAVTPVLVIGVASVLAGNIVIAYRGQRKV